MSRWRQVILMAVGGVPLLAPGAAWGDPFMVSYTDGGSWSTVYAQGFSPSLAPNPNPSLGAGDTVYLDEFRFFKSGNTDSASNIRLLILSSYFTNLQGLNSSWSVVSGLSTNTVASTGGLATGDAIVFDFDNLPLTYGNNYAAVFVNVGTGGELTPVQVSALVTNYTEVTPGDWHPATNYGGESGSYWNYATSNFINTDAFGSFFNTWSYGGDANFSGSLLAPSIWNIPVSGDWSTSGNWSGGVPAGTGAIFGAAAAGNVTINTDVAATVGHLGFDNSASSYTIGGANGLTLNVSAGQAGIQVVSGSHAISAPLTLADDTTFNIAPAASTLTVSSLTATGRGIMKVGAGTLVVNHLRNDWLNVQAGTLRTAADGGAAGVSVLNTLAIDPSAALDLADNDLVVNNMSFSSVQAMVLSGFGNTSGGITSSTSDGSQILALFDNAQVGATDWQGIPIGASAIVGKYTYFGDANIDGQVTGDDYTVIDANLNTTPSAGLEWLSGDMNLDGLVTGDDYTVIDANLGLGSGNPLSVSAAGAGAAAVPEPGSIVAVGAVALGVASRRRRR